MMARTLLSVQNRERGSSLGDRVGLADRWWPRLRGLLGRSGLSAGEGLLITSSQGVHMFGMKFSLDVALLDKERKVVALYRDLRPWKRTRMHWDAHYALELPVGKIDESGTLEGDVLEWTEGSSV